MIEPTDEMVHAFLRGYADADDGSSGVILNWTAERAGLAAALAIVERDYLLTPICNNELMPGVVCKRTAINPRHTHEATLPNGSRAEWT